MAGSATGNRQVTPLPHSTPPPHRVFGSTRTLGGVVGAVGGVEEDRMTEIIDMTADELRIAIAKAKGWTIWKHSDSSRYGLPLSPKDAPGEGSGWSIRDNWDGKLIWQNEYSDWPKSISAAWGLAEEMLSSGMSIHIDAGSSITGWFACAYPDDIDTGDDFFGLAETAPIAICRAWLAWKAAQ